MKMKASDIFLNYIVQNIVLSLITLVLILILPKIKRSIKAKEIYKVLVFLHILFISPLWIIQYLISQNTNNGLQTINISAKHDKLRMLNVFTHVAIDCIEKKTEIKISFLLLFVALSGSLVLTIVYFYRYCKSIMFIKRWNKDNTNTQLLKVFNELKIDMGVSPSIKLVENEIILTPMVIGIFKKSIVFPEKLCNEDDNMIKAYLYHEMTHIKHRDNLIAVLSKALRIFLWFNPVIHLMYKTTNLYCEIACDESVLYKADLEFRNEYLKTVRKTLVWQYSNNFWGRAFSNNKKIIHERVGAMLDGDKKQRMSLIFPIIIGLLLVFWNPVYNLLSVDTVRLYAECKEIIQHADGDSNSYYNDVLEKIINEVNYNEFYNYTSYGLHFDSAEKRLYYDGKLVRNFEDNGKYSSTVLYYLNGDIDVVTIYENKRLVGLQISDTDINNIY